jgi:hypothetical protein
MRTHNVALILTLASLPFTCTAQQAATPLPDASTMPQTKPVTISYEPPTQQQRFKNYVQHTFGLGSLVEAGVRGGIDQARNNPSQWGGGAEAYGKRFASAGGQIAIRGTSEYLLANLFKEDLRVTPCTSPCSRSIFKAAFDDTFLAKKGQDGHAAFSVARLVGPLSGSAVAVNTWYPAGSGGKETFRGAGVTFSYIYIRNLIRELEAR